jgi:hypothetical protein
MKNNQPIAYLTFEKGRLYIEYQFKGVTRTKTDVTPLWHFFKEFQEYLRTPEPGSTDQSPCPYIDCYKVKHKECKIHGDITTATHHVLKKYDETFKELKDK